jgi:large subunit ribosomal protein L10
MTRAQKAEVIDFLTNAFKEADGVAICDYKGMSVSELEELRKAVREIGGSTQVVKNSLAMIALKNVGVEGMELADTNLAIWADDQIALAKAVVKFAKDNEKLVVKQGYMDGSVQDAAGVVQISKMPSKEELIGMLLSVWQAPMRNFLYVTTAPARNFVTALGNLAEKQAS